MEWYVTVLKKYFEFEGRARRKEFWMFALINFLVYVGLAIVGKLIGLPNLLSGLYSLAVLLPSLGVSVRRLHDTDRTGWWVLISLVPILGLIVMIIFTVQEGTPGPNQYGPNPKESTA